MISSLDTKLLKRRAYPVMLLLHLFYFSFLATTSVYGQPPADLDSLKKLLLTTKDDTNKVNILLQISEFCQLNEILQYAQPALALSEKLNYENGNARALNNIGFVYDNNGQITLALDYYSRALKILQRSNDNLGIATELNNMATIYYNQHDEKKALEYYTKSLHYYEKINDRHGMAEAYNNMGGVNRHLGNYAKSTEFHITALKITREINDSIGIASSLHDLGMVYGEMKDPAKALPYFIQSLNISKTMKDEIGMIRSLNNIGAVYFDQKKYVEAERFCLQSLDAAKQRGLPEFIRNASQRLRLIYEKTKRYNNALEMYKLYIQMSDSINNRETEKAAVQKQMQYEFDKQQAADSVKVAEGKKIAAAELKTEVNKRTSLYAGLALVLIFVGFIFNRFRVTQKQKAIIEAQKEMVEEQKKIVEEKNKDITDSIHYARRIQRALLPTEKYIEKNFRRLLK